MVNPYQAPSQSPAVVYTGNLPTAEFQLTGKMIRYAESRYLLYRCGIRLTVASLAMIGLAIWIMFYVMAVQPPNVTLIFQIATIIVTQIVLMLLASFIYLSLVRGVRRRIRKRCKEYGVTEGATCTATIADNQLRWSGPTGSHSFPIDELRVMRSRGGLVLGATEDMLLFIPSQAHFDGVGYRDFLKLLSDSPSDPAE